MKDKYKILALNLTILFALSQQTNAANNIVRYSEYRDDWTLEEQYFDLSDDSSITSKGDYDIYTFKISTGNLVSCNNASSISAEYGENLNGLGKIEIVNNSSNQTTTWKFKPGLQFSNLLNNEEVIFCYSANGIINDSSPRIRIIKSEKPLIIRAIGTSSDKKILMPKKVGNYNSELEISFRCEPDDIATNYDTGENEEKITFNFRKFNLKIDNNDIKVKAESNGDQNVIDTVDTNILVSSQKANLNFYFDYVKFQGENVIQQDIGSGVSLGTNNSFSSYQFIEKYPDYLQFELYKGKISSVDDIKNHILVAKANGKSLSTSIDVNGGANYYSLVTYFKNSSANPTIKVYNIFNKSAEIIRFDAVPGVIAPGTQIEFTAVTNLYNTNSQIEFIEVVFDDNRFNNFRLYRDTNTSSGADHTNLENIEQTFKGGYIVPSDTSLHGVIVSYKAYIVLENGLRTEATELSNNGELYIGSKNDICIHPSICVIRGLRALKSTNKTDFYKTVISLFTNNPEGFSKNDIYKKYREMKN